MAAATKTNVFWPAPGSSLKVELALLALPALAIGALLYLIPAPAASPEPKVTLRVTSATPSPEPELLRERQLAREHIAFALSKIARPAIVAAPRSEPATSLAAQSPVKPREPAPAASAVQRPMHVAAARRHRNQAVRPTRKIQTSGASQPRVYDVVRPGARRAPLRQDNATWLDRLTWPVTTAVSTLAPVTDSVARTVQKAGNALETIKRKVL